MLDLRAGNARCRKSCAALFVGVGGSSWMVCSGYSADLKKLAEVELAERGEGSEPGRPP